MLTTKKLGSSSKRSARAALFASAMLAWCVFGSGNAFAGPLDPPADARTWVYFAGGGQAVVHPTSVDAQFTSGGLTYFLGFGEVTANSMRASNESRELASFMTVGLHDTYTVHGPAELLGETVTIEAVMRVEGKHGSVTDVFGRVRHGDSQISGKIGTWTGRLDSSLVNDFPGAFGFSSDFTFRKFEWEQALDFTVTHQQEVVVGETFDLAYSLASSATTARIDASNTATIDFVLPEGITLTSELGWTSPAVVPEPSTLMLAVTGGTALALFGRRRRSTRKHASQSCWGV